MNKLAHAMAKQDNLTHTENGAVSNKSTLNPVLDFFYHAPARRASEGNVDLFQDAYDTDPVLAVKMLFYLRDVRGGKGERESFRMILRYIYNTNKGLFNKLVPYVAYFGRWDDLLEYTDSRVVQEFVRATFVEDMRSKTPSLLAKWMPSANTSSKATRNLAREWINILGMTEQNYRQTLSRLRAKLNVLEVKMSDGQWEDINYSAVPGRAMKLYGKAFGRHDYDRFNAFINRAMKGEVKINSGTVYPHELVAKYISYNIGVDKTVEAQWTQLPNYCSVNRNALAICDVSGSMFSGGHGTLPINVSIALGIYLAQRNTGAFKNLVMTFSNEPKFVTLPKTTLFNAVHKVKDMEWGGITNLQAAFKALLKLAVDNNVPGEEMPEMLFIISDMQFNDCVHITNLEGIRTQFDDAGYKMPMVAFWNVDSRRAETPATANENGVYLLSGFSPEAFKQALNLGAKTPEQLMLEVLNSERYEFVDELLAWF